MKHLVLTAAFAGMASGALAGNTPLVNSVPTSIHTGNFLGTVFFPPVLIDPVIRFNPAPAETVGTRVVPGNQPEGITNFLNVYQRP